MVQEKQKEMSSRETILSAVKANQPELIPLPAPLVPSGQTGDVKRFQTVVESIGGKVHFAKSIGDVIVSIQTIFPEARRIVSAVTSIEQHFIADYSNIQHQSLHDVDVVVIEAQFGVVENGSVWITETDSKIRVLPFIGENLVVLVNAKKIVPTMHHAYEIIADAVYGFGVFIAGPSKTADIEQSLVLGAHGPKSMNIFVMGNE
jgi:L-lactate dehydrogenase complex protein LldG